MIRRRDIGGGGAWPDLAGDVLVYALPSSIVAARIRSDGLPDMLWVQPTPEPLMFVRAAATGSVITAVGKGNVSGAAYLVRAGQCEQLAPIAWGNNPIAILAAGAGVLVRWIEAGGIIATRWPDGSVTRDPIPAPWTGTSTGILDLAGDGSAIYMDAGRTRQIGAWTFSKPIERAGIVVGQTDGAIRVAVAGAVFTALEAADGFGEDPHLSVLEGGRLLVTAYTTRGASLAIVDPPYPPPELPPLAIAPFTHPVLIAPFKDLTGESGAPAEIVVNRTGQTAARPYFVAEDSLAGPFRGELLGIYSEASLNPIAALRLAESRRTRLLLCHDASSAWTIPSGLRRWDIPAIELYRFAGETLAQARMRWVAAAQRLLAQWPGDCALIAQFYCMTADDGGELWTVAEVLDGLRALSAIVNSSPRIKVVAPFAWQRANGITGHVELRAAFARLLAATPGVPTLTPVPTPEDDMNAPKVDIKSYDPVIAPGQPWRLVVEDSGNGEVITVEKRANDSLHVGIRNAKGEDVSGRVRLVKVGG